MARAPRLARIFMAELLGTMLLVVFTCGSKAQKNGEEGSDYLHVALATGLGLMVAILAADGVSGAHVNPAVSVGFATVGKCKLIEVPLYWLAQYLGGFFGAAIAYGVYFEAIDTMTGFEPCYEAIKSADKLNPVKGKSLYTAGIFATFPNALEDCRLPSTTTLVFDQMLAAGLLMVIILAVTDERNCKVPPGLIPPLVGLGLTVIRLSYAGNAGAALNPAADFGPRVLLSVAGFGSEVWTAADHFFWIPWLMPHFGMFLGALLYQGLVRMHHAPPAEKAPLAPPANGIYVAYKQ